MPLPSKSSRRGVAEDDEALFLVQELLAAAAYSHTCCPLKHRNVADRSQSAQCSLTITRPPFSLECLCGVHARPASREATVLWPALDARRGTTAAQYRHSENWLAPADSSLDDGPSSTWPTAGDLSRTCASRN